MNGPNPTLRGPSSGALDVPPGLEALADVFLEKTRTDPVEVVDIAGRHWLLAWRAEPEPQVAVHALDRRTALPALAEVTAHDLAALLAWGMEPRPRTPLLPVPDRVWRLYGLEHPLAAAIRRSRADVLQLRAHGLPDGFAVEIARAGLALHVQDHRRAHGESLLPIVLWSWSGRGVWPPMRRAIPPGDLLERIVHEAPPARSVEELASALRRLARMPASQLWSAHELDELRAVLDQFGLQTPPVEVLDVDREGGVAVTWRGDRLVAAMPPIERMSPTELDAAARMLKGLLPDALVARLTDAARQTAEPTPVSGLPKSPTTWLDPLKPTTRRSAAAAPANSSAQRPDAPVVYVIDRHAPTPVEGGTRGATPHAAETSLRQASIGETRRDSAVGDGELQTGSVTVALPTAPAGGGHRSTRPASKPVAVVQSQRPTAGTPSATAAPAAGLGSAAFAASSPAGAMSSVAAAMSSQTAAGAPVAGTAAGITDDWMRGSVTPAAVVAEPADLRSALQTVATSQVSDEAATGGAADWPSSLGTWLFAAGVALGFVIGYLAGQARHAPVGDDAGDGKGGEVALAAPSTPTETGADASGNTEADQAVAAGATTDDLADDVDPAARMEAAAALDEPRARHVEPEAAAPAAPAPDPKAPGAKVPVATGPGFAALGEVNLWDGTSAPWSEAGVQAHCNLHGDLELSRGGVTKVLVCGVFYTENGHLLRYATCADKPTRCVDVRSDRAGTRSYLCTPRSARPLVRVRQQKSDPMRYSSDIALRKTYDTWRKDTSKPLCEAPARYWSKLDPRWMDAGAPPADQAPAGAPAPAGAQHDAD